MSEPIVGLGGNRLILDEGHPPDDETRIEQDNGGRQT